LITGILFVLGALAFVVSGPLADGCVRWIVLGTVVVAAI
jgi:hypothetical protein